MEQNKCADGTDYLKFEPRVGPAVCLDSRVQMERSRNIEHYSCCISYLNVYVLKRVLQDFAKKFVRTKKPSILIDQIVHFLGKNRV
jgi:hypothetical protein